jgi:hypothetical protein
MPKITNPLDDARLIAAYEQYGSFDKAAVALGVSRSRVYRAVYRSQGRCECGRMLEGVAATCLVCTERAVKNMEQRRADRAKANQCRECGEPLAPSSKRFCPQHLESLRRSTKAFRQRQKADGLCSYCDNPRLADHNVCKDHLTASQAYSLRYRAAHPVDVNDVYRFGGLRNAVLERDGFRCVLCAGADPRIEVHHIHNGTNTMDNLVTLCVYCHKAVTFLAHCKDRSAVARQCDQWYPNGATPQD